MLKLVKTWHVTTLIILISFMFIFFQVSATLYLLYGLIILACILLQILIIKNFNLRFKEKNNINDKSITISAIQLGIKIFVAQVLVFLLSMWLIANLLAQSELNIRTSHISSNLMPDNVFMVINNSLVIWLVFVGLLLGINLCKYYFNYPSTWISFAKCLFPTICKQPWLYLYRMYLTLEGYIKIISLDTIFVVLSTILFEIIIRKYQLHSFFEYPMVISFMIMIMFYYFLKRLWKIIDFCSKKTTMSFISVFIMLVLAGWVVIFISGQILLGKLSLLKSLNIDSGFINNVFNNVIVNKDRIKILSLSINILLSVSAANLLLPCSYKYKVGTVYIMSSIAPLVINCVFYKWCSINFIINFLTTDLINILMSLIILIILILNCKNIYSISELVTLNLKNKLSTIKTSLNIVIKRIIYGYFLYLSSYYMFGWIVPMHALVLGSLFLLSAIITLLLKIHLNDYMGKFDLLVIKRYRKCV